VELSVQLFDPRFDMLRRRAIGLCRSAGMVGAAADGGVDADWAIAAPGSEISATLATKAARPESFIISRAPTLGKGFARGLIAVIDGRRRRCVIARRRPVVSRRRSGIRTRSERGTQAEPDYPGGNRCAAAVPAMITAIAMPIARLGRCDGQEPDKRQGRNRTDRDCHS
jgi:hypothetical protein